MSAGLEDGEEAGVVVGPEAEAGFDVDLVGEGGEFGLGEEGGVGGHEDPLGAELAARVDGVGDDVSGFEVGAPCEESELQGQVEVLVGDVEGEDAVGGEVAEVELERLGGEQVEGDGVAGEGVDGEDVEALRVACVEFGGE